MRTIPLNATALVALTLAGCADVLGIEPVTSEQGAEPQRSDARCGNSRPDPGEACDNGVNSGACGTCMPDCSLAPVCGCTNPIEQDHTSCFGGDVYWYDSCNNRDASPVEVCDAAGCVNGACESCPERLTCGSDGNLYAYTCETLDFSEECCDGLCAGGACSIPSGRAYAACYGGSIYSFSSCGVRDVLVRNCGGDGCPSLSCVPPWPGGAIALGTGADEEAFAVTRNVTGIYVVGYTSGGLDGATTEGGSDAFLTRYDLFGRKQWTRQIGTASEDRATGVAGDTSGNIYVVGSTRGAFPGHTNAGDMDIFVARYDAFGMERWVRQLGTSAEDLSGRIAVDGAAVYVVGTTRGTFDGAANIGDKDAFIIKYDWDGVREGPPEQFGTSADEEAHGLAIGPAGDVYVVGRTMGNLDGPVTGLSDLFLRRFTPSLVFRWTRQAGSFYYDSAAAVAVDDEGSAYVVGYAQGAIDGESHAGAEDVVLIKWNASGTRVWSRLLGTASVDFGYAIAASGAGSVTIAGTTAGRLGEDPVAGLFDIFVARYDSLGTQRWLRQVGSPGIDRAFDVALDADGGTYIVGGTTGTLDGDGGFDTTDESADAFLLKLANGGGSL